MHGGGPVAKRVGARDAACNMDLAEQACDDTFKVGRAVHSRALCERHGCVDGVDPSVIRNVKACTGEPSVLRPRHSSTDCVELLLRCWTCRDVVCAA